MMSQYHRIKRQYKDAILFFRLGDFYEMFYEDAQVASRILEITLTSREKGKEKRVPMAGIPYHAAEPYIARLLGSGYKVAICEQVEDPNVAKGLVKREIVRVITPGTVLESLLLDEKTNNYLMAINKSEEGIGLAFMDLSTGKFEVTELCGEMILSRLESEIAKFKPSECLLPNLLSKEEGLRAALRGQVESIAITNYDDWAFNYDRAYETLTSHFGTHSLKGFGCENMPMAISAAGAIIQYLNETQKAPLTHLSGITTYSLSDFMVLDAFTQRNLELLQTLRDGDRKGSLLEILDRTVTAMGARLLRNWILRPLLEVSEINARLEAVEELYENSIRRNDLREEMKKVYDIERLASRVGCGRANAKDLVALKESLKILPQIKEKLKPFLSPRLQNLTKNLEDFKEIVELIESSLVEDPPPSLYEGGLIRQGFNQELDRLKNVQKEGKDWIAQLQRRERERTRIASLKVGFNNIFGYYIEVTRPNLHLVPPDYIRKQTLVNAERFITPELKERESLILEAEERITNLEYELFNEIRTEVGKKGRDILATAHILAQIDVLSSLAEVAVQNDYHRPQVNNEDKIIIKDGRHPVVEKLNLSEPFIPNNTLLDCTENQLLIITGPNMAGKSTYIRQVALIVLMAQMGSFVPAKEATIGVVDRIFTRVGASDSLIRGESTFMVEMNETANILNNATKRSLIILDEIGRGTSTYDGLSIAWAVAEYIHNENRIGAKTLFATHYHELTELALTLPRVKNYNIAVREWNEEIIFLRKVIEGGTDRSYGIQVARLAGLPPEVIERAKEILFNLEANDLNEEGKPKIAVQERKEEGLRQLSLFDFKTHPILEELEKIDVLRITPIEALKKLEELKKIAKKEKG